MTSRALQTASARRPSSTQGIQSADMVRVANTGQWLKVNKVLDTFNLRVEDLLTGETRRLCIWDVDRWG